MASTKPSSKDGTKGYRSTVPQRRIAVTLPDGTSTVRMLGPKPDARGGVRKRYARKIKAKSYAWNTKRRRPTKKSMPKSHYKQLSEEKKADIRRMDFTQFPAELRNLIYPDLLDQIEEYRLYFTNWTGGPVPGWPASKTPRAPIGLLTAGNKQIRGECLSLAYEKADIHIRILSAHLKSTDELYAWVSKTDCIPFAALNVELITKLSLTIFLPCSFETNHTDQTINLKFLAEMTRLKTLRLRIQVHVARPHNPPWTTFGMHVPDSTFTHFVNRTIDQLFLHVPKLAKVEFGDGVRGEDGGLGSWVDERADGRHDQGWMMSPVLVDKKEEETDTVAISIDQAEKVFGDLRAKQGTADVYTRDEPVEVEDGVVEWLYGKGLGSQEDAVVLEDEDGGLNVMGMSREAAIELVD